MKPKSWQIGITLIIGTIAVSLAAIFIRLSMAEAGDNSVGFSLFLAASRLLICGIILLPNLPKIKQVPIDTLAFYYAIAAGICLGLHFATWIASLGLTSISASTTLVTTNPIWVAILSRFWLKERLGKVTIWGIAIALSGSILIALGDASNSTSPQTNPILGDLLALIGAIAASFYIVLGSQAQKQGLSTTQYIAIAYSSAAILLLPLPLLFNSGYFGYPRVVYLYVFLMAIVSQLIGHTIFNWAVRWISPTFISLSLLSEPIFSSYLGWLIFTEQPSRWVFAGGTLILIGVGISIAPSRS